MKYTGIYARNWRGQNSGTSVVSAAQLNVLLRLLNEQHRLSNFQENKAVSSK